jgi:hypothetical protein
MPEWSSKDERQYEHIKESSRERGVPERRAKAIAGRTVNKKHRSEGRTPQKTTQGTGNPNRRLEERSKDELYNQAKKRRLAGRARMSKGELVNALRSR